jgi:hypothetical protein
VPQDPGSLRAQLTPVRPPQALDFLGKVLPIERQVGTFGLPQLSRLLLGPAHEVFVVEVVQLRHFLIASVK